MASGTHADGHAHDEDAIGKPGIASAVTRTVNIDMSDSMRFTPASIQAKQGETIRFVIKNSGKLKHEFVLGSEKELKEHYQVMKKNPEMEHSDPNMVTLAADQAGEVLWQFSKAGKIDFACLQPGHYDAGMKGKVQVSKSQTNASAGEHQHHAQSKDTL
ncbi:cupredoxin domain-containing protein [Undibacterium sp. Di26W]|uniref:cupredoxin domain-containing protein n=1 Tax=Undibacterium sp. Di26W TaxID=3413035 RepID=UPI003BF014CD